MRGNGRWAIRPRFFRLVVKHLYPPHHKGFLDPSAAITRRRKKQLFESMEKSHSIRMFTKSPHFTKRMERANTNLVKGKKSRTYTNLSVSGEHSRHPKMFVNNNRHNFSSNAFVFLFAFISVLWMNWWENNCFALYAHKNEGKLNYGLGANGNKKKAH